MFYLDLQTVTIFISGFLCGFLLAFLHKKRLDIKGSSIAQKILEQSEEKQKNFFEKAVLNFQSVLKDQSLSNLQQSR